MCRLVIAATTISIHALREESDQPDRHDQRGHGISIHALREESDQRQDQRRQRHEAISIHALREESDRHSWNQAAHLHDFNPRSP